MLFLRSIFLFFFLSLPFVFPLSVNVEVRVPNSHSHKFNRLAKESKPFDYYSLLRDPSNGADSMSAVDADGETVAAALSLPVDQILKHNTADNCWVVLNGDVLNLNRFEHPFKDNLNHIVKSCGKDVTHVLHAKHRDDYDSQLVLFKINPANGEFLTDQTKNPLSNQGNSVRDKTRVDYEETRAKTASTVRDQVKNLTEQQLQDWLKTLNK